MPEQLFDYVGPREIAERAKSVRFRVDSAQSLGEHVRSESPKGSSVTFTFVIDRNRELWIADRRSEHVACARGGPVLAAGELTVEGSDGEIAGITNQSTGFCPKGESWSVVAQVLGDLGIFHPDGWTFEFEFRRCPNCKQIQVIKENDFECPVCEEELPREWNF